MSGQAKFVHAVPYELRAKSDCPKVGVYLKMCRHLLHHHHHHHHHHFLVPAQVPGAISFVGPEDIPKGGSNIINCGSSQAPIFAQDQAMYVAEPLGIIVANSPAVALQAAKLVSVQYNHPKVSFWIGNASRAYQPTRKLSSPPKLMHV